MNHCRHCNIPMYSGDICWMCELEQSGIKEVYVSIGNGKIVGWQSFKNDLCPAKLKIEKFIKIVNKQYPRGE